MQVGKDSMGQNIAGITILGYTERHGNEDLSLWPSGICAHLVRKRLRVQVLAVSDTYPIFIEPKIIWVPSGISRYIWHYG